MPTANRLTLHVLSAVAEHERGAISARTKAALAAAKARGVKLGNPSLPAINKAAADARVATLAPLIAELQGQGLSLRAIVAALNARKVPTASGGRWHLTSVKRLVDRLATAPPEHAEAAQRVAQRPVATEPLKLGIPAP